MANPPTTKFKCERDHQVRIFDSFAECQRFVRREGDESRLWSYVGTAQLFYIASLSEPKATTELRERLASVDELARLWSARPAA